MTKVSRTFRIDQKLSNALDKIYTRHGDNTYHVEQALAQYGPIKMLSPQTAPSKVDVREVKVIMDNEEFDRLWDIYGKKGNKKTSRAKFNKLHPADKLAISNCIHAYVLSTPDKQYRKNFETYINQECWNDEVIPNGPTNQSGRNAGSHKLSAVERVRQAGENREQGRQAEMGAGDGPLMVEAERDIRQHPSQPVRGTDTGSVGTVIEGSYTRADR